MYYLVKTPDKWYYIADFPKIKELTLIVADWKSQVWYVQYKSNDLYDDFMRDIEGAERKEITKEKHDDAKLKYREYSIKSKT